MPSVKQCSKCNTPFECTNDAGGCWCEGYTIDLPVLRELKDNFDNCLCPKCLAKYAESQNENPAHP